MSEVMVPQVFISYSWSSPEHQNLVRELGEKLMTNGVHVFLDIWDLKEGQDKFVFMESMVTNKDITKVLVICDKKYATKADERVGGVGTETQIISNEIYQRVTETKFIPVIFEKNEDGSPCLPVFMKSRIFVDFSKDSGDSFEKLIRVIFDKPLFKKPSLGTAPTFLLETVSPLPTVGKYQLLKESLEKDRSNAKGLFRDYLSEVHTFLASKIITEFTNANHDDEIYESIASLKPLRNEICEVFTMLCKHEKLSFFDSVPQFFEDAFLLLSPVKYDYDKDNLRFFVYELYLYFIASLIKYEAFSFASEFMEHSYLIVERHGAREMHYFDVLKNGFQSLDVNRKNRLKLERLSVSTDLLKDRADLRGFDFEKLCEVDYLLWFRSRLLDKKSYMYWFPETLIYVKIHSPKLEMLIRAESKIYFEKIKILFKANSLEDLKNIFKQIKEESNLGSWRLPNAWHALPLEACLNLEKLATR